jgi:uncharacterized protein with PIN domain
VVYLDTSALVALVANEPNAQSVKRWLAAPQAAQLCSSDWCVPEVASALSLKVRTGQLDEAQADASWQAFGAACDGLLDLLPVQAADYATAAQMCRVPQAVCVPVTRCTWRWRCAAAAMRCWPSTRTSTRMPGPVACN